jgi:hypothetical protein
MVNYQNGLIYKIVCNDIRVKETYYGSTTNFNQRVKDHKKRCNINNCKESNNLKYKFIRANGGWSNWKVILIKEFPCNSKRELEREERLEMEQDNFRLNIRLPTRKNKEWIEDNKERLSKQNKIYRQENKEIIRERRKIYRQENKEKIKEQDKKKYEKNKEQILEQNKEKITCECGSIVTKGCLTRHKRTTKHLKLISNK